MNPRLFNWLHSNYITFWASQERLFAIFSLFFLLIIYKDFFIISRLNSNLSPSSWSTTGLTFANSTYQSGGYVTIGKLVIVCIRVIAKNTIAQYNQYILTGLPVPLTQDPANYVGLSCACLIDHKLYLNSDGNVQLYTSTSINADEVLIISGSYIRN